MYTGKSSKLGAIDFQKIIETGLTSYANITSQRYQANLEKAKVRAAADIEINNARNNANSLISFPTAQNTSYTPTPYNYQQPMQNNVSQSLDLNKYLPFILGGVGLLFVVMSMNKKA